MSVSVDCNCSFPMVEDKALRTELLILGFRRSNDFTSTCFSVSASRPSSPDLLRIMSAPSSLTLSRLSFSASRAGRAAGFPWFPFCFPWIFSGFSLVFLRFSLGCFVSGFPLFPLGFPWVLLGFSLVPLRFTLSFLRCSLVSLRLSPGVPRVVLGFP